MHFLLKIKPNLKEKIKIKHSTPNPLDDNVLSLINSSKDTKLLVKNDIRIVVIGDLIIDNQMSDLFDILYNAIETNNVHKFGGFFYLLLIDNNTNDVKVFTSLFNILPVYYHLWEGILFISSNIQLILDSANHNFFVDKQYLLERTLFNYGLFNKTYFEEITLVKSNHYLHITDHLEKKQIFDIADYYVATPKKGKNVLNNLSEKFVKTSKKFFPSEFYALSFTGGFDGRTLLAVSKHYNKNFFTYSFGTNDSDDVYIPLEQSRELGIEFTPIYLEQDYVENHSYKCGKELIEKTEGYASFARAHYLFATKKLSEKTKYLITGNFGSELFRAMHNPGVMISQELIEFFQHCDEKRWIKQLNDSPKWRFLNRSEFQFEFNNLIDELKKYKKNHSEIDNNQFLYKFIYDEILRKYFGPEIYMQRYYLNNRAPFLDFSFIEELLKTYYCGVYSDFFTDNPIMRYKGQLVYPYIIKKAYPKLLELETGKGYKPKVLLSHRGKLELTLNLIKKKFNKSCVKARDPFAVRRSILFNQDKWTQINILNDPYNADYIIENFNKISALPDIGLLINIISSNYYLSSSNYGE